MKWLKIHFPNNAIEVQMEDAEYQHLVDPDFDDPDLSTLRWPEARTESKPHKVMRLNPNLVTFIELRGDPQERPF